MGTESEERSGASEQTPIAALASLDPVHASEKAADSNPPASTRPSAETSSGASNKDAKEEAQEGLGSATSSPDEAGQNESTKPEDSEETENQDDDDAATTSSAEGSGARVASTYYRPLSPEPGGPRGPNETAADYLKRTWICEVERASMQDWRKRTWHNLRWPLPIIQAFYNQKPPTPVKSADEYNKQEAPTRQLALPGVLGESKDLQRICINSEYLFQEFLKMSSIPQAPGQDTTIIIGPPYKILMRSFPDMEARLAKLKEEMDDANANELADDSEPKATSQDSQSQTNDPQDEGSRPAGDGGSGKGVAAQEKEHEPEENQVATNFDVDARDLAVARYTHLKVLHDFVKDELSDVLDLRSKIANSTLENIHFEDLWHLFKPGDVIYSTENGHDQLYKVYFITGGQSLKRSRTTDEITEINNLRDKLRYWTPPPPGGKDEDDEETIEKMLREEGSGIGTWTPFKVDCYMMAFDGERCGPVDVCKKIRAYQGERAITSLPMYPLRFHPKKDELLQTMLERGRKFLFAGGHKSYDGRTLSRTKDESQVEIQSDVYIDFDAFYQDFPHKKPTLGRILRSRQNLAEVQEFSAPDSTRYRSLSGHELDAKLSDDFLTMNRLTLEKFKPEEDQISDDVLCLMPHYVVGYAFQLRKWFHLDIDLVKDINRESASARAAGFDDLVISKRYRDLLVALVDSHASGLQRGKEKIKHPNPMPTQIDLVRGKGQGLIILLHGPPGSGKTSTAETIAAYTRRPLYSITCGDIGTAPDIVEKNLLEHTRRADKWGCVLLLDEADVFLVQRDWSHLMRNALTSIFLRQLEYYAGILFLTTNRPGVIDEAFKSRVHISLRYPGVDLESTKKQWSNILNRLEADNKSAEVKVVFDKEALLDFAQRHFDRCEREGVTWNGRQIRNAFQTALALGHYERLAKIREAGMTPEEAMATGKKKWRTVKLTKANFANIAKTAREFEQYIETLRGSDSVNARESELRYDEWDPDQPRARKQYPVAGSAKDAVHQLHANVGASRAHAGKGKKAARVEHPPSEEEEEESAESDDLSEDDDED